MCSLPEPSSIPTLSTSALHELLSHLFEPSPALTELVPPLLSSTPPSSYADFVSTIRVALLDLVANPTETTTPLLLNVLSSHPRLGAKKVDSAHSQAEQKSLQGSVEEAEKLRALNEEYEAKFPGLRYVVFVNGRSREVIMENMRARIDRGDREEELREAVNVSLLYEWPYYSN